MAEAQVNNVLKFRTPQSIRSALDSSVPMELFELYDEIMATIFASEGDSKTVALNILSWLFRARRPLKIVELCEAIAVQEGVTALDEDDLIQVDDVIEVCGSLVNYHSESGIVSFSHEQVREYLMSKHISELLTEIDLAKTCLIYLSFDVFEEGACADMKSYTDRLRHHPFSTYAADYWGSYMRGDGERDPHLQLLLLNLTNSTRKLDSIAQITESDDESGYILYDLYRSKSWLHFVVESNLTILCESALHSSEASGYSERDPSSPTNLPFEVDIEKKTEGGRTP